MSKEFYLKCLAVVMALLQPIIILSFFGTEVISISSMWGGHLQPLFICTNAITSYFFFQTKQWIVPSIFLLLLTAFSVNLYPDIHNVLAGLFFISSLIPMIDRKYNVFGLLYLFTIPIGLYYSFFWMEFWAIYVLCAYHLRNMYIIWKYEHR